jgi:hypothetical protein
MTDERDQAAENRALIARLSEEVVPSLIERLTNSELGELEVRESGWRIRLRRPLQNGHAPEALGVVGGSHHAVPVAGHGTSLGPREAAPRMTDSP